MGLDTDNSCSADNEEYIIKGPPSSIKPDKRGLGYEVFESMKEHGNKIAQYLVDEESEETYSSMLSRCVRTALRLRSRGLGPNDLICISSYNHRDTCIPYLAAIFLGTKVACLDPSLPLADQCYLLGIVKPKMMFVSDNGVEVTERALNENKQEAEIVVFGETHVHTPFETFLKPIDGEEDFEPYHVQDLKETALVLFSSGTTGLPKGICISHYALIHQPRLMIMNGAVQGVCLCYSTFYWISATLFFLGSTFGGFSRVICRTFDPVQLWSLIEKYKITTMFASPTTCTALVKYPCPKGVDISTLREMVCSGGSLPLDVRDTLMTMIPGVFISSALGTTETCGPISGFHSKDPKLKQMNLSKPDSCGFPTAGFKIKIVDPATGSLLPANTPGEIVITSPVMTTGFYNQDSSAAFDSKGWLRVGDLGYYDTDHCLYVVGRLKEVIKYRGWQIFPLQLEQVVEMHPLVQRAAVFGVPDHEDGEHPIAVVELVKEAGEVDLDAIRHWVDEKVADYQKLRGGLRVTKKFPLTPTGKVRKKDVKELVLEGKI